jgi:RimJ/RimL family protein N-acetyltransferase
VGQQFAHTDCDAVHGTPNVENVASIKMQEAAGGLRIDEGVHESSESMRSYTTPVPYCVYRVEREAWEGRKGKPIG